MLSDLKKADTFRYTLSGQYALLLSVALLPAYLALPFASSELFCGFALLAMCALIIFAARRRATVLGLVAPAYLTVLFTGRFAPQAVVIGVIFAAGVSAFLIRGHRTVFALVPAALAALLAALARGAEYSLLLFLPLAAGLTLAALWCRRPLSGAVAATAAALAAAFFCLFAADVRLRTIFPQELTVTSDLAALAASFRAQIYVRLNAAQAAAGSVVDESYSARLSELAVNTIPALLSGAALILGYLQHRVVEAFADGAALDPYLPASSRELSLSPIGAFFCIGASVLYLFASLFSGGTSFLSVLAVNIVLILILPFFALGTGKITLFISDRILHTDSSRSPLSVLLVGFLIVMAFFAFFIFASLVGLISTLLPLFRTLRGDPGDGN